MPRMNQRRPPSPRHMQLVGVLVVVAAILVVLVAYIKPNPLANELTVRAQFKDAGGIGVAASEVRVAGTPVGKVTDVRREDDHAIVTMAIDPGAGPIGRDASAELRPRTAFEGTSFIDLDPGTGAHGRLGDRVIPQTRTRNFVALDEALRFAVPKARAALSSDVHAVATILRPEGRDGVQGTLRGAPALTRGLALGARAARGRGQTELRGAVNGFAATVGAVAREQASLLPVLRGATRTLRALDTDGGAPLDRTLQRLPSALADLDSGGRSLGRLVDRVDVVGGELRPGLRELTPALDDAAPLVRAAGPVLSRAVPFLRDVRGALDGGGAGAAPASRLLRTLDPTLGLLSTSLLPALEKPTGLGMPSYLQFIALFQGGAGAFRPFTPPGSGLPGLDPGPGHFTRFSARFLTGVGAPLAPCSSIGRISAQAQELFLRTGMCTP